MNSQMFQMQTGQYLCVFISHEKYVFIINTEFAISIMSTPTKFFPFSVRNITTFFYLSGLSFIFALFDLFEKYVN